MTGKIIKFNKPKEVDSKRETPLNDADFLKILAKMTPDEKREFLQIPFPNRESRPLN
jgi:hypothetical protein